MKEKILALLMAAFAGVRKDGLNQLARTIALQATTDDEAKALVEKLTKAQVDEFVKEFRAEVDKEVSESNKTYEVGLKKKYDFVEKKNPEPGGDDSKNKGDDEVPAWAKNLIESNKQLSEKLSKYEKGDITKSRLQEVTEKLKSCKDGNFGSRELKNFQRLKDLSEDEYKEYLTDLDTDIATANQNVANSNLGRNGKPWMPSNSNQGDDKKEASKEEIDAVIDKLPI